MYFVDEQKVFAGKPTSFVICFTAQAPFATGDKIWLILPNFTKSDTYQSAIDEDVESVWNSTKNSLEMTIQRDLLAKHKICHTSNGLSVPLIGIRNHVSGIKIATDSHAGPVRPVSVLRVATVGALESSSIVFDRPLAGNSAMIIIHLTPLMAVEMGRTWRFHLPGFRRGLSTPISGCTYVSSCFWNESQRSLIVSNLNALAERETFTFSIPKASGIRLPQEGVRPHVYDYTVTLLANDRYGNVNPTNFIDVQAVGSFSSTRMQFFPKPPVTRRAIEIRFQFSYINDLKKGDIVAVQLPGFSSSTKQDIVLIDNKIMGSSWPKCSWSQSTATLEMTASGAIPGGALSHVEIPEVTTPYSVGLLPPVSGSLVNNALLMILTVVPQGPVLPTSVEMSDAIGSLGENVAISFFKESDLQRTRAGSATDVTFTLVTGMVLNKNDNVTVFLNKFTLEMPWTGLSLDVGPAGARQNIFHANVFSVHDGSRVGVQINLTPTARVPASTLLSIKIPAVSGVTIPVDGVKMNDQKHTISADFAAGRIPERNIDLVSAVGAFALSGLSYSPRKVKTGVELTLVIETYMNILKGENLVLHLPDFAVRGPRGPSDIAMVIATSNPQGYLQSESGYGNCEWRRSFSEVTCLVANEIPARQVITIKFAREWTATGNSPANLWLPNDGIETDDTKYAISTNAKNGPVQPSPIMSVMGVMALFVVDGLVAFTQVPFSASRLSLTFSSSLKLQKGDNITLILPGFQKCKCPAHVKPQCHYNCEFLTCDCQEHNRIPVTSQPAVLEDIAIWHEGAGGYASAQDAVGELCVGCGVAGSCYASQLKFAVKNQSLEPKTSITVEIPRGFVRLPVDGIRGGAALNPVLLQTETLAGVLIPFSIPIDREVPALMTDVSLQLGSPVAGSVTGISLRFRLHAPAEKGSKLMVSLPSFIRDESWTYTGANNAETVEVVCTATTRSKEYGGLCNPLTSVCCDPSPLKHASKIVESFGPSRDGVQSSITGGAEHQVSIFQLAEWNPLEQKLILELTSHLKWNGSAVDVHVSIPSSAGIRVPASGLSTGNPHISAQISLNVPGATPTTDLVIQDFPKVAPLFTSSKISFINSDRSLDTNVGIDVEFILAASTSNRYAVTLQLPGFSRSIDGSSDLQGNIMVCFDDVCSTITSRNALASWDEIAGSLTLKGLDTDMQSVLVKINVAKAAGMRRPPDGVDTRTGLMLAVRVDGPAGKPVVELKTDFDEEEGIDVITKVALDFQPRVTGKPASISVELELSFDLLYGDTITLILPGFSGADIPFIPKLRTTLDCRVRKEIGLQKTPDKNCAEKSFTTEEICRPGGLCKANWYGQECESYCDDIETCNLDQGLGFCNLFGACTCFPPHRGRFCNATHAVQAQNIKHLVTVQDNCAALSPMASTLPDMQVSFAASWTQSSSALTLTATGVSYVPATTIIHISMPTNSSEVAINLPESGLPSPIGDMQLIVQKAGEQSATIASRINAYAPVVRFLCRSSIINIPNAPLCDGLHTVRVCARSQRDADAYAVNVARPLLQQVTASTCLDETCGVGARISVNKQSCCMLRTVADLGVCATDADCMSVDTSAEQEEEGVPMIDQICCHFCNQTLSRWCKPPIKACSSCSKSTPCWGYKLTKDAVEIDPESGGRLVLDSGSGISVPPGVWPTGQTLEVEVYSESFAVEAVAEAVQISEALFFGPSGLVFPEPGVTLSFQISPERANPPAGSMIAVFKIVNGVPQQHPFAPVINATTGVVQVKTLGFSAYVLLMMPTPFVKTPAPDRPIIDITPTSEVAYVYASPEKERNAESPLQNPVFVAVVVVSALVFCGLSTYAYGWYLKQSRTILTKELLLDGDSYRMQEELEPAADLVAADGEEVTPPSSRIGRGDVERILSLGDGMDENEPPIQSQAGLLGSAALSLSNIFGSIGVIGTGARVPRAVRPVPSEVQSTVLHGTRHAGQVEMTADLVVIDQMERTTPGVDEDMEEEEPTMEEAEPIKPGEWDNDPYYAQEFEQFSSSAPESSGSHSDRQTPFTALRSSQEHDGPGHLSMPFDGGEDQEEAEPKAQEILVDEQDEYDEFEPGPAEEI
jgi:hypothetical protein